MSDLNKKEEDHLSIKIVVTKNRFSLIYKNILEGLKTETIETKQASKIAFKYISKGTITKEEETELREQVYDILKTLGVGIPFALIPGASILIPVLLKVAKKKALIYFLLLFRMDKMTRFHRRWFLEIILSFNRITTFRYKLTSLVDKLA